MKSHIFKNHPFLPPFFRIDLNSLFVFLAYEFEFNAGRCFLNQTPILVNLEQSYLRFPFDISTGPPL
jgi:hypothetical protein